MKLRLRILAILLLAAMASCTGYVDVPPGEYDDIAPAHAKAYRVRTTDGATYAIVDFTVVDSTIVVEQIVADGRRVPPPQPLSIPLSQVTSIERAELRRGPAFFVLFGMFIVVLLITFPPTIMTD
jgi:hypothetical protein